MDNQLNFMDNQSNIDQGDRSKNIKEYYKKLSQDYKHIIYLTSLAYFFENKTQLLKCLKHSKVRLVSEKAYSHQIITKGLDYLEKNSLIYKGENPNNNILYYDDYYFCNEEIIHLATQDAIKSDFFANYLKGLNESFKELSYFQNNEIIAQRTFRLAIYINDNQEIEKLIDQFEDNYDLINFLKKLFIEEDLEVDWLKIRPISIQNTILESKLDNFIRYGKNELEKFAKYYLKLENDEEFTSITNTFQTYHILKGDLSKPLLKISKKLEDKKEPDDFLIFLQLGIISFITEGNQNEKPSTLYFKKALAKFRTKNKKRNIFFEDIYGLFYMLSLLQETKPNKSDSTTNNKKNTLAAITIINKFIDLTSLDESHADYFIFELIKLLCDFLEGRSIDFKKRLASIHKIIREKSSKYLNTPTVFCALLTRFYIEQSISEQSYNFYVKYFIEIKSSSPVLAEFIRQILNKIEVKTDKRDPQLKDSLINNTKLIDITNILECKKHWQRSLENIESFLEKLQDNASKKLEHNDKRLVWKIAFEDPEIVVLEQSRKKKKTWTKGRRVALKRFYNSDPELDYLTDKDKAALTNITKISNNGWYGHGEEYDFNFENTLLNLAGHPNVYHYDDEQCLNPVELILSYPELVTKKKSDSYNIKLSHDSHSSQVFIEKDTENRYRLINFSKQIVEFQKKLGDNGINIPLSEKKSIIKIAEQASKLFNISSDSSFIKNKKGDSTPIIQLTPYEQGLKLNIKVRPFKNYGPYYSCGIGSKIAFTLKDDKQERVERKLNKEKDEANILIEKCPTLKNNHDGTNEWILLDHILCLEILTELNYIKDEVKIEWPEGEKLSVLNELSSDAMSITIQKKSQWFYFDGGLDIKGKKTLKIKELLDKIDNLKGRFIELEPGKFVALTKHFKNELQKLKAIAETDKKENRIHSLGIISLENFSKGAKKINTDKQWQENLNKVKTYQKFIPKLPSTLKADLRDYQFEGFQWISRLANLGAGACLADDMGLGKTVQAIALMLEYTQKGAIIVIAPTSVCHNWESEIKKFAPTLNVFLFSEAQNRTETIDSLSSFDVLITSYGLLNTEKDLLERKSWEIVVLDEAQAIKNHSTQRTKAAYSLQGNFRMALSGTPIENSLNELWSLFNFINPGLLGTNTSFKKRFLIPIEQNQDEYAKQALNSLISPFMLRRTKNKVLKELPARIEKDIYVDMNDQERSFYEALRLKSIEKLTDQDDNNSNKGGKKIHILAELLKLRQAACNPMLVKDLVKKNTEIIQNISSSKMKVFLELVSDLIANNHKALVFSQFVTHLSLIRDELDKAGIKYQYLDGSTPARLRKDNVKSFQAGEYDLFLISLKAGGTGLNLTAADYVIHLDPWWNPAVEDQASDRAHRLGQLRPVTIYRLITKNTIEEKILQLHQNKRQMTSDLLSGKNVAKTLTEKELLSLLEPDRV